MQLCEFGVIDGLPLDWLEAKDGDESFVFEDGSLGDFCLRVGLVVGAFQGLDLSLPVTGLDGSGGFEATRSIVFRPAAGIHRHGSFLRPEIRGFWPALLRGRGSTCRAMRLSSAYWLRQTASGPSIP